MCTLQTELTPKINNRHHTLTTAAERADDVVEVEVSKCGNIGSNEKAVAAASVVTVMNVWVQYLFNSLGKKGLYLTRRLCRSSRSEREC